MPLLRFSFFVLLLMWCCVHAYAQRGEPNYRRFSTADGLPSSEVYVMKQDRRGVLWFGTDHGLCSYDGTAFRTYSSRQGLFDNTVFQIEEDSTGRLWLLTFSGRLFFLAGDSVMPYAYNNRLQERTRKYIPTDLCLDQDGGVSLNVQGSGSFRVSRDGVLEEGPFNKVLPPYRYVIERTRAGKLLPLIFYNGFYDGHQRLQSHFGPQVVELNIDGPFSNRFRVLPLDGSRLLFSLGKTLYLQEGAQLRVVQRFGANILTLARDREGGIWLGTDQGAYHFRDARLSSPPAWYLRGEHITCIVEDHEGGYWFSSLVNGVFYTPGYGVSRLQDPAGMVSRPLSLAVDSEGRIYSGDWSGALVRYGSESPEVLLPADEVLQERPISWLSTFPDDPRVYLSRARPSYILDSQERAFLTPALMGSKSNYLRCADGTIYCAGSASIHQVLGDSLIVTCESGYRINCLAEGPPGQLLLGTNGGVILLDRRTHEQVPYDSSLTGMRVEDLQWMGKSLLVATKGHGVLWRKPDGAVVRIGEAQGLCSDLVRRIRLHGRTVWCATNQGVGRIDFDAALDRVESVRSVHPQFGLISNEVDDLLVLRDTLYAAGPGGISVFACGTSFLNPVPPPVSIVGVSVNERSVPADALRSLSHDQNTIQVLFNAVSFRSGGQLRYRYQLTHGTDTVAGTTTSRDVQFLALRPGAYRLSVYAINASGIPSAEPAVLAFSIHPAWWQTLAFRLLLTGVLALAVYALYRRRLRAVGRRYTLERERANLQLTAMRAQMNPHFIFNVMNSIRSYMLNKDTVSAEKYLTSFSRLVRYTLDHSDEQEVELEEELKALASYVELEQQRFTEPFGYRVEIDPTIDVTEYTLPSLLLQPFVENAIKHGIATRGAAGWIRLRILPSAGTLRILIEDNGLGRSRGKAHAAEQDPAHVSHGTGIAFARMEAFNKAFNRQIRASYSELEPGNGEFPGTRVEVEL